MGRHHEQRQDPGLDRIAAEAAEIRELLRAGARAYVGGDGSRMAPGMRDVFRTLFREHTSEADETAAERWPDGPVRGGHCIEDVCNAW